MFQIRSFLKHPQSNITDLGDVVKFPEKYFVEITDLLTLRRLGKELDFLYLDGAISMKYNDEELMGFRLWDLVDQLWAYLLNIIQEYIQEGKGKTYFPDQPVELMLQQVSDQLLMFSVNGSKSIEKVLPKDELLLALLDGAEQFFTCMSVTFNSNCDYSNELQEIKKLRGIIG